MSRFLKIVACLWLLACLVLSSAGLLARARPADIAIVPGNTVYRDGSPSSRLAARLDRAFQCYQQHQCGLIFVSGGVDASGTDEAVAMRAWLMRTQRDLGVRAELLEQTWQQWKALLGPVAGSQCNGNIPDSDARHL